MALGRPSIAAPNQLDLRAIATAVSNTRQRIEAIEMAVNAITAANDSVALANQIQALRQTVAALANRVFALENASTKTNVTVNPANGTMSLAGLAPTVRIDTPQAIPAGALALTGLVPTVAIA